MNLNDLNQYLNFLKLQYYTAHCSKNLPKCVTLPKCSKTFINKINKIIPPELSVFEHIIQLNTLLTQFHILNSKREIRNIENDCMSN